ncbi:zinc finger RNA-binding protein-like isoform X2 [Arachis ipaensis]|uniref:zinc finger RNA-binding protein-like isoform X2 n=1 Tax=Arachis ipaensis TaxID=130454 RepID=UPI0007AF87E1|nr:zinc finger RNA-binding protein-like isoform X2 [Arachis ipaensis]
MFMFSSSITKPLTPFYSYANEIEIPNHNKILSIIIAIAMDYTTWPEFQHAQTQTPTLPSSSSLYSYSYPPLPSSSSYTANFVPYPQNPNPPSSIPPNTVLEPVVNPPGVDSYVPPLPLPTTQVVGGPEQLLPQNYSYTQTQTQIVGNDPNSLVASSGYYYDPNAQNWGDTAGGAVIQYGSDPLAYGDISMASNGTEQLAVANTNPAAWWTNTAMQVQAQPLGNNKWKQLLKKKPKTVNVQPAYCEVCKIDCTSKEVLDQHKLGKKHKKNVEKLRELLRPPQPQVHPPADGSSNPVIGPQLWNKCKRKSIETPENLEKKKKKVLEGGAAAAAVKVCSICNVVCNSETVYNFHLRGQKHAAMLKKASENILSNGK